LVGALTACGVPAISWIIATLRTEQETFARAALSQALARIGRPAWEPLLAAAAKAGDNDEEFGISVTSALIEFKNVCEAGDYVAALHHCNIHVRRGAAEALGHFPDANVVAALVSTLREHSRPVPRIPYRTLMRRNDYLEKYRFKVRLGAASSLRAIGAPAFPALLDALRDANPLVRAGAAEALTGATDPGLFAALAEAARDPDPAVRRRRSRRLPRWRRRLRPANGKRRVTRSSAGCLRPIWMRRGRPKKGFVPSAPGRRMRL
jgi:HEAT repeat protein